MSYSTPEERQQFEILNRKMRLVLRRLRGARGTHRTKLMQEYLGLSAAQSEIIAASIRRANAPVYAAAAELALAFRGPRP